MSHPNLAAVQQIVSPIATEFEVDLEDIEIRKAGNRDLVKIVVDKASGISLDEIAAITKEISEALDGLDQLNSPFTLEVTSPGVDRPLTLPRHWQRNLNRLVKVWPNEGEIVEGRIIEVGDQHVLLQVKQQQRNYLFSSISKAVVQVEFNKPKEA